MSITILIADDHDIVREGIKTLLASETDFKVVAEACNGRETVTLALQHKPAVILMDVGMPDLNGVEATAQICAQLPEVKVIALSMHADRRYVRRMFASGASGYLLKNYAFKELVVAIRAVHGGMFHVSPHIAGVIMEDYMHVVTGKGLDPENPLTPREREVLQLIAEGKNTKGIATLLDTSPKTIETHRMNIMEKLKMRNVAELVKYAMQEGMIQPEA